METTIAWFSSKPVFEEALFAVKKELQNPKVLNELQTNAIKEILPLNNGEPFMGETSYGPHTTIWFKTSSLSHALIVANAIKLVLNKKFPNGMGRGTGGIYTLFNGKTLYENIKDMEEGMKVK